MSRFGMRSLLIAMLVAAVAFPIVKDQVDARPISYLPYDKLNLQASLERGDCVLVTLFATWTFNTTDLLNGMSPELRRQLRRREIVVMYADFTNGAGNVGELMQELNITAVPALALFDPSDPTSPRLINNAVSESELISIVRASGFK